jgi:hypothetical protein
VLVLLHPILRARGLLTTAGNDLLQWPRELTFVSVIVGTLVGHTLFGTWGWWCRYEIYAVAVATSAVIVLWHAEIASFMRHASPRAIACAGLVILVLNPFYVRCTLMTPLAGRGIYEQQYQMHRFAVDFYRQPVAVNDLGWASYRNPNYVLDLWGLGSEAARKARLLDHKPGWLDNLARSRGVGLAMIYSSWFMDDIPVTWRPLAVLRGAHRHVTAANDEVMFYATSISAEGAALAALHEFAFETPPTVASVTFRTEVSAER